MKRKDWPAINRAMRTAREQESQARTRLHIFDRLLEWNIR